MLDLYANLQSGTQRQHQTEFCMFIEAVLSLPLLFRVLIRQDGNSTRWFERIQSTVLACWRRRRRLEPPFLLVCFLITVRAPEYNNVMNIKEDVQPWAYWTALIYPVTAAEKETLAFRRAHQRYSFSAATAGSWLNKFKFLSKLPKGLEY